MDKSTELKLEYLRELRMLVEVQHVGEVMSLAARKIGKVCIAIEKDLLISTEE